MKMDSAANLKTQACLQQLGTAPPPSASPPQLLPRTGAKVIGWNTRKIQEKTGLWGGRSAGIPRLLGCLFEKAK